MDNQRFDDLTRALAAGTSRRRVLKLLAGGLGAGALALTARLGTTEHAAAQVVCSELGVACESTDDCCEGLVCDTELSVCISDEFCFDNGEDCFVDEDCCSGYCNPDTDTCDDPPVTCAGEGETCADDLDCCDELICEGGICVADGGTDGDGGTDDGDDGGSADDGVAEDTAADSEGDDDTGGTTQLPTTGRGPVAGSTASRWLTPAALAGAAAALFAGRLRASQRPEAEEPRG